AKRVSGASKVVRGIAAFPDGGAILTGEFEGVGGVVFGPDPTDAVSITLDSTAFFGDMFAARFGADGTVAWATQTYAADSAAGNGVAAFPDGSAIVTGTSATAATFGLGEPGQTDLTGSFLGEGFVARYRAGGTLERVKRIAGAGPQAVAAVADGGCI